ncbi:CCA tRNA nucleotidyltransferase [Ligilactobacillus sp. Marseille-Q7487]|uniref:CCA tRNA nucleotidyltransferase n=1 Tax=Ligilactobacillus sp. Marseille-Q7487 TaxID=3022128 RepID=UPI0024A98187|nr:CCA tRNA nucleotidyltransferase [Ligilactobacillus sp. Marseille-Q7487]
MRLTKIPQKFKEALPILKKIQEAGFEAYFVGGSVRDTLLGLEIHDIDIATSAYPAEIKQIFSKTVDTGIEHGTVMVLDHGIGYEITTFRTESTYQDYRRPDKVEFVRSLAEDLKRRDLTINALAMDSNGQIVDLFGGLSDLDAHIIRAVGIAQERFHEDALRMMRALRFSSQLDFKIEKQTLQAIVQNAPLLEKIAVERIHVEWIKLLKGKAPSQGLQAFIETKMYRYCPLLETKKQGLQTMLEMQPFSCQSDEQCWAYLSFCLNLTKQDTVELLRAWKCANETIQKTQKVIAFLQSLKTENVTKRLLFETGKDLISCANQLALQAGFGWKEEQLMTQYELLPLKNKKQLCLNGKDLMALGYQPGPSLGELLARVEQLVLDGQLKNNSRDLEAYAIEQLSMNERVK